jgi:hypothetical protein
MAPLAMLWLTPARLRPRRSPPRAPGDACASSPLWPEHRREDFCFRRTKANRMGARAPAEERGDWPRGFRALPIAITHPSRRQESSPDACRGHTRRIAGQYAGRKNGGGTAGRERSDGAGRRLGMRQATPPSRHIISEKTYDHHDSTAAEPRAGQGRAKRARTGRWPEARRGPPRRCPRLVRPPRNRPHAAGYTSSCIATPSDISLILPAFGRLRW